MYSNAVIKNQKFFRISTDAVCVEHRIEYLLWEILAKNVHGRHWPSQPFESESAGPSFQKYTHFESNFKTHPGGNRRPSNSFRKQGQQKTWLPLSSKQKHTYFYAVYDLETIVCNNSGSLAVYVHWYSSASEAETHLILAQTEFGKGQKFLFYHFLIVGNSSQDHPLYLSVQCLLSG